MSSKHTPEQESLGYQERCLDTMRVRACESEHHMGLAGGANASKRCHLDERGSQEAWLEKERADRTDVESPRESDASQASGRDARERLTAE